ncbi:MAG: tetratricopeptide repeat protein [Promethearchaeota archaeon]
MLNSEATEFIQVEKLIDQGKHEEAIKMMKEFEQIGEASQYNNIKLNLLKCELFYQKGMYEIVIDFAQKAYEVSLSIGKSLFSVDALLNMARASIFLYELENAFKFIRQSEEMLKTLAHYPPIEYKRRKATIDYEKGRYYGRTLDFALSIKHLEESLAIRKEMGEKKEIARALLDFGWIVGVYKGELDRGLEIIKQGFSLAKENDIKFDIACGFNLKGCIYGLKGNLDRTILNFEKSLTIFKELNNKERMAAILNNLGDPYKRKGLFDRALEYLEQSLILSEELGITIKKALPYDFIIQILIEKGDLERAEQHLIDLENLSSQLNNKHVDLIYFFNKALILKANTENSKRNEAEVILKQILDDKFSTYEIMILTLLNLCDILIFNLSKSHNLKYLDELVFYVNQIMNIARNSQSYWLLAESYLIQAKLKLLILEFEETRQLLTQAEHIAEKYSLNLLNKQIEEEKIKLSKYHNNWKDLKHSNLNLTSRIELTGLEDQIRHLLKKRLNLRKTL